CSLRLAAQDVALSRRKQGFESPRERQSFFVHFDSVLFFVVLPNLHVRFGRFCSPSVPQASSSLPSPAALDPPRAYTAPLPRVSCGRVPPLSRARCTPPRQDADQQPCEGHAVDNRAEAQQQ